MKKSSVPEPAHLLPAILDAVDEIAKKPSEKRVHHLRTSARRLQALLAVSNSELSTKEQRLLRRVEALRKKAGKVRDLDVQSEMLQRVGNGTESLHRAEVLEAMRDARDAAAAKLKNAAAKLKKKLPSSARKHELIPVVGKSQLAEKMQA